MSAMGGAMRGADAKGMSNIDNEELLEQQKKLQQQSQQLQMQSNINKSLHDTSMAAIRNIRA